MIYEKIHYPIVHVYRNGHISMALIRTLLGQTVEKTFGYLLNLKSICLLK